MLIAVIILAIVVIFLAYLAIRWRLELNHQYHSYFALETGMDEVQENLEQQYLSLVEAIDKNRAQAEYIQTLQVDLETIHRVAEHHSDNCIPDYAPVLGQDEYLALSEYSENPDKYVDKLAQYVMEPHLG